MKKALSFILALCMLCGSCTALAGGFLPSINQVYGVDMPSLSYVLRHLPDSTEELPDGGSKVTYMNVTEVDYDAFSTYLGDYGCTLLDYAEGDNGLCFTLEKEGCSFTFEYSNLSGIAVLTYPAGCTEDLTWAQDIYNDAMTALEQKDYVAAAAALKQIKGYKDVDSILADCENEIAAAARRAEFTTVGKTFTFGHYEQDNNTGNGKEAIEWQVLEVKGDKVLIISKNTLDAKPYNNSYTSITWEKCTLRAWLNRDFLNAAFSTAEQAGIETTTVDNSKAQGYSGYRTNGGNNTQDKVFLLSYAEAWKYFGSDSARVSTPTKYAKANEGSGYSNRWWLRSPGYYQDRAALVNSDGACANGSVDNTRGVRPALWVNLESGIFKSYISTGSWE